MGEFDFSISVPLVLEYEEILLNKLDRKIFSQDDISDIINYICKVGIFVPIFYLWRPFLTDPEDDHILELAVAANCSHIVTYNKKDFRDVEEQFGIKIINSAEFLELLREKEQEKIE